MRMHSALLRCVTYVAAQYRCEMLPVATNSFHSFVATEGNNITRLLTRAWTRCTRSSTRSQTRCRAHNSCSTRYTRRALVAGTRCCYPGSVHVYHALARGARAWYVHATKHRALILSSYCTYKFAPSGKTVHVGSTPVNPLENKNMHIKAAFTVKYFW